MLKETLRRRGEDRDKLVKEFKEHYANLEKEKQSILDNAGISQDMLNLSSVVDFVRIQAFTRIKSASV